MIRQPWPAPARSPYGRDLVNELSILLRSRYPARVVPRGTAPAIAREVGCARTHVLRVMQELGYRTERQMEAQP